MAIIKLAEIDPLQSGRRNGTRFFRSKGRTLARQIVHPTDPKRSLSLERRTGIAGAARVWTSILDGEGQAIWDSVSRFDDRGELELSATAVRAEVIGEPQPTDRGAGTTPSAPDITDIDFQSSPERLRIQVISPGPSGTFATVWKINGPRPPTRAPTRTEIVVFRTAVPTPGMTNLLPNYKTRFAGQGPNGRTLMIELAHYAKAIPATGQSSQVVVTDQTPADAAWATLENLPMGRLGTAAIKVFPRFEGISPGVEIASNITAADFTTTLPTTAPNLGSATGSLTDTLGIPRTGSLRITLNAGSGRIVSILLTPLVTI